MNFFSWPSSCRPQEQRSSSFRPSRRCQGFTVSTRCSRSVRRQLQQVREDACSRQFRPGGIRGADTWLTLYAFTAIGLSLGTRHVLGDAHASIGGFGCTCAPERYGAPRAPSSSLRSTDSNVPASRMWLEGAMAQISSWKCGTYGTHSSEAHPHAHSED